MKIKVIIFDLDRVLFDSDKATVALYRHIFRKFGKTPPLIEDMEFAFYQSIEQSLTRFFKDDPRLDQVLEYARAMDVEPYIAMARLNEDVHEVLDALYDFKKAVCTNRSLSVPATLKRAEIAHYFDLVVTAGDVKRPKPHPEPLLAIVDHFGIQPDEALFVGDSLVDLHCAQAAKVPFLAYRNPNIRADRHIQAMDQIFQYLGMAG